MPREMVPGFDYEKQLRRCANLFRPSALRTSEPQSQGGDPGETPPPWVVPKRKAPLSRRYFGQGRSR